MASGRKGRDGRANRILSSDPYSDMPGGEPIASDRTRADETTGDDENGPSTRTGKSRHKTEARREPAAKYGSASAALASRGAGSALERHAPSRTRGDRSVLPSGRSGISSAQNHPVWLLRQRVCHAEFGRGSPRHSAIPQFRYEQSSHSQNQYQLCAVLGQWHQRKPCGGGHLFECILGSN
jgi:hypothetical protein